MLGKIFSSKAGFSSMEMVITMGAVALAATMGFESMNMGQQIAAARAQSNLVLEEFVTSKACDTLLGGQSTAGQITINDPSFAGSRISERPNFTGGTLEVGNFVASGNGKIGDGRLELNRQGGVKRSIPFRVFAIEDAGGNIARCDVLRTETEARTSCSDVANGQIGSDGQCYVVIPNVGAAATPSTIGQYAIAITALSWADHYVMTEQQQNMNAMANAMEMALQVLEGEGAISVAGQNAISVARQSIAVARQATPLRVAANAVNSQLIQDLNGLMGIYLGLGLPRIPDISSYASLRTLNITAISQPTTSTMAETQLQSAAASSISSAPSTESAGQGQGSIGGGGGGGGPIMVGGGG